MDLIFPPSARISRVLAEQVSNTAVARSIFTGAVRSTARGGDRWRFGMTTDRASGRETYATKANLQVLRHLLRGQAERCWVADPSYSVLGSFASSELLPGGNFTNAALLAGSGLSLSVVNGVLRAVASAGTPSGSAVSSASALTVVPNAPYGLRGVVSAGSMPVSVIAGRIGTSQFGIEIVEGSTSATGYFSVMGVPAGSSVYPALANGAVGAAGDYFDIRYLSFARCAAVDNLSNLLTRSDNFGHADWSKANVTVTDNNTADPFGASTADAVVENTSTSTHGLFRSVTVTSAVQDLMLGVAVQAGREHCILQMDVAGGSVTQYFNVNTGALGSGNTGTDWANRRAYIVPMGGGWYFCFLVARKTSSATTVTLNILAAAADGTATYTGTSNTALRLWRATFKPSSLPSRLTESTSTAVSSTAQSGAGLYLKGLPVSETGLLLPGARVQIGTQYNMVTARLDSNAAGLGHLQCATPWRTAPADNAPMFVAQPLARCVAVNPDGGWDEQPGGFSGFEFAFEEALDA